MILTGRILGSIPGLRHGFSTRLGGVSEGAYASLNLDRSTGDEEPRVRENRARFAELMGLSAATRIVQLEQVHGTRVAEAERVEGLEKGDALIARTPGVAIGVRTADCAPILIASLDAGGGVEAIAAVHAGWRGATAGILGRTVRALAEARAERNSDLKSPRAKMDIDPRATFADIDPRAMVADIDPRAMVANIDPRPSAGVDPLAASAGSVLERGFLSGLRFAIGPTIGVESFEVGWEVVEAARASLGGDDPPLRMSPKGTPHLDLPALLEAQLLRLGIAPAQIERVGGDTFAASALYYSHRRDRGVTGRHLAAIAIAHGR